jgi:hypothetical protein
LLVVVAVVLVIFGILGLTAGNDNSGGGGSPKPKTARKPPRKPKPRKPVVKPRPTSVQLRVAPVSPTYVCVDHGLGTPVVFQGTIATPQVFKGRHLRVNIGNTGTVKLSANRKRVTLAPSSTPVGLDFRPGRSRPIPAGQKRPCT